MGRKTEQLQVRITTAQKAKLRRLARKAGVDVSSFVLARALSDPGGRFTELLGSIARGDRRFPLAELNDLLSNLAAGELREAVAEGDVGRLTPLDQNYVAAMVEQACDRKGIPPPGWTGRIEPLAEPYFAVPFRSLRLHLLGATPVPFRRRNIFVDSAIGARV
jgi:hypothetical protein